METSTPLSLSLGNLLKTSFQDLSAPPPQAAPQGGPPPPGAMPPQGGPPQGGPPQEGTMPQGGLPPPDPAANQEALASLIAGMQEMVPMVQQLKAENAEMKKMLTEQVSKQSIMEQALSSPLGLAGLTAAGGGNPKM